MGWKSWRYSVRVMYEVNEPSINQTIFDPQTIRYNVRAGLNRVKIVQVGVSGFFRQYFFF